MKKIFWLSFIVLAVAVVLAFPSAPAAQAAGPFTVNTSVDSHDAAPGNGVCADASNLCSLRAAIEEASTSAASTTISLPAGTYNLTLGELQMAPTGNRSIVLNGAGAASTIVHQTNAIDRVISVDYNIVGNVNVAISGLTISGGSDRTDYYGGAGILAGSLGAPADTLTLNNLIFANNHVSQPDASFNTQPGGALQMAGGNLTVSNCSFTANSSAASPGGAIAYIASGNAGTVNITDSTFTDNQVANTALSGPSGGGAIYLNNVTATISRSTFTGNQATSSSLGAAHGGAILFNTGSLTIDHSTFTTNQASGSYARGGAIYVDSGALELHYSRLTGNQASTDGSGIYNHDLNNAVTAASNNWWGCTGGPSAAGCDQVASEGAGQLATPWITLTHTANPLSLSSGGTATLTASFLQNSAGQALAVNDISALVGLPVTWANAVNGSLSNQQITIQSNGLATATFTAGATNGPASASAQVDNAVVTANLTVTANADLMVSKTAPTFGVAGETLTYTLTVHNNGPEAAANVALTDPLPVNLTFVSQSQTSGPAFTLSNTGNSISDTIANLPSGATAAFTIVASVDTMAAGGTILHNTASVSSTAQDPASGNNTSSVASTVYVKPAITSSATASFTLNAAGSFTFTTSGYPTPALSLSGALPTGVSFTDNGDGTASLAGTPALGTAGAYPVTVTASNAAGSNAVQNFTLTVQKIGVSLDLQASPNPSVYGQTVTLRSTVTSAAGTPTGSVQFSIDGTSGVAVALDNGVATVSENGLSAGSHAILAAYNGDANFQSFTLTTPVTQVVSAATTISTLEVTYGGGLFQEDALLSVSVTPVSPGAGIPAGTVTFSGSSMITTMVALDANGQATVTVLGAPRGDNTFTVTYSGNGNFLSSTGTQTAFAPYVRILPLIVK